MRAVAVLGWTVQLEAGTHWAVSKCQPWSREHRQLLAFSVQRRQQWLDALSQAARLLNAAADGGSGGIQSWVRAGADAVAADRAAMGLPPLEVQWGQGGAELIIDAVDVTRSAATLLNNVYGWPPLRQLVPGEQPPFAATPEGAAAVVECSELLVRLAAKRAGLHAVLESRPAMNPQHLAALRRSASVELLLGVVTKLLREDALKAPALVGPSPEPAAREGEARLQAVHSSVRSLAASAAKLVRLMPAIPAMEPGMGSRHHYAQHALELAVALSCRLLTLHPQLLPGPAENLTGHLRWACGLSELSDSSVHV